MKDLMSWMNNNKRGHLAKVVTFNDGTTVSIQAGEYNYSIPRENREDYSDFQSFELGFPSRQIDLLMTYAEDKSCPTGTVYGYVPREVIEQLVKECGGVNLIEGKE
jgi:hypothetical protein